jgi:hypothetical protein
MDVGHANDSHHLGFSDTALAARSYCHYFPAAFLLRFRIFHQAGDPKLTAPFKTDLRGIQDTCERHE